MATAPFSIALSIEDTLFGKNIQFANKRVELWKKEAAYDEQVGEGYTNNDVYVFFNFEVAYTDSLVLPVVYFKIFDGAEAVAYEFPVSKEETTQLEEGQNDLWVHVNLKDAYTSVSNEVVECNAVVTDDAGEPYSNLSVAVNVQDGETVIQELGTTSTNPLGFFSYSFVKDRILSALIENNAPELQLRFKYLNTRGELIEEQIKLFSDITDFKNLLTLQINLPEQEQFSSATINGLAKTIGLTIPSNLLEYFDTHEIVTLRNIRSFGGLKRIPALQDPAYDQEVIKRIDGHSQLETLSGDFIANNHIIDEGYDAVYKIAMASRSAFTKKVAESGIINDFEAAKIQRIASAHSRMFQAVYVNYRVNEKYQGFLPNQTFTDILNEINDKCNCDECEAAISPIAYLADLIWYVQENLKMKLTPSEPVIFGFGDDDPVTPEVLKEIFCNDFCLTEDYCNLINEKICQYRVAIETLNCFRGELPEPNACQEQKYNRAERQYLITAYFTLLEQLGTTYFELRDVKNSNDIEKKKELADKLGIALDVEPYGSPPQTLSTDILYFDPYNTALSNTDFNTKLETIFGLRNFNKSCTDSQPAPFIKTWKEQFLRLQWKKFDSNHDVYSLNPKPILDPDYVTIDDFRDPFPTPTAAFNIWLSRKNFLEEIWNDVFRAKQTPHGAEKEARYITVDGNHVTEFQYGKRFTLISPTSEKYTYTAEYAELDSGDTKIHVLEKLENAVSIDNTWQVRFLDSAPIASVTVIPAHTIVLQGANTVTLADDDTIEIYGSGAYDGVYHVDGAVISGSVITIHETFPSAASFSAPFPDLYYYHTIDVVSATVVSPATGYIRLQGDVVTEIDGNLYGYISGSANNDGKYAIEDVISPVITDPDFPNGCTEIEISDQLPETADDGEFTYLSADFNVGSITPDMGVRRLIFTDPYAYEAIVADTILEIEIDGDTHIYTVDDVTGGGVDIEEALTDQEAGKNARIKIDDVDIDSSGEFTIDGNYENIFNDPEITSLEITIIGGATYSVDSVTYDIGNNTSEFILNGFPSGDAGLHPIVVDYDFNVTAIDVSGRKFTVPKPSGTVLDDFKKNAKKIAVIDVSDPDNPNNNEYTLISITEIGSDLELYVQEPIQDDTSIPSGSIDIRYKETTVSLFYQHPKIQAIFNYFQTEELSYPIGSGTPTEIILWEDAPSVDIATFIEYRDILLTSTNVADINNTLQIIEEDLHLTRDSFIRLANIAEKYYLEVTRQQPNDRVTADEYTELFNILISAVKKAYQENWYQEEDTAGIKLNYINFWQSLTEPVEGSIDNSIALDRLLIDPQLIGLNKLPDMPAGLETINLWNRRNDYLVRLKNEIKTIRISEGFDEAVAFGLTSYGPLGNIPAVANWKDFWDYFNDLLARLSEIEESAVEAAEKEINNTLYISVQDFRTVMQLHKRLEIPEGSTQPPNPPAQEEYEKLYQILVGSYKRRVLYPEWRKYEATSYGFYEYTTPTQPPYIRTQQNHWLSAKARLPKWRASAAERQEWLNALASRSIRPIIDPDLLFPDDFASAGSSIYTIYSTRKNTDIPAIKGTIPSTINPLEFVISGALKIKPAVYDFSYLLSADEAGEDIRPRLAQLHITYQGFSRLKTFTGVGYSNMNPDERNEFFNILIQAIKIRDYYALWRDVESSLANMDYTITLSPDNFKVNKPAYNESTIAFYDALPSWRTTWKERREWEQTLAARIEQVKNAHNSVENIIDETEKQVLPIIRDALVMRCGDEQASLADNAKALETRLLVDFSINCCQSITRVSHAIDVLQKLLWSESLGIDKNIQINPTTTLEFVLDADNFEEEWKWLGSYSTWRAAMFVFMYPENLLLPSLRHYQSPAFIKLVNEVQGTNRLTPLAACRAAKEYSIYYEDIASLEPEATSYTRVKYHKDVCLNKNPVDERMIAFLFATGKKNKQAYFHTKIHNNNTTEGYSYWEKIEGLGNNVVRIAGSAVYEQDADTRHILLFAVIREELKEKFVFIKYDLTKQYWDNEYTELEMPEHNVDYSSILVWTCSSSEKLLPEIIYKGARKEEEQEGYPAIFLNRLNNKVKDWENDEWEIISPAGNTLKYADKIHSYILISGSSGVAGKNDRMIVASDTDGRINYKLVGPNDDLTWRPVPNIQGAEITGVFNPYNTHDVHILFRHNNQHKKLSVRRRFIDKNVNPKHTNASNRKIRTFYEFNRWLIDVTGYGLSDIALSPEGVKAYSTLITAYYDRQTMSPKHSPRYHERIYESEQYLDRLNNKQGNLKSLFQAYQCLWDANLEHPTNGHSDRINLRTTLDSINSWLCDTYIEKFNKEDSKAADFKWIDGILKKTMPYILFWYYKEVEWRNARTRVQIEGNNPSLKELIDSLLNYRIAFQGAQDGLFTQNNGRTDKENWENLFLINMLWVISFAKRDDDLYSAIDNVNYNFDFVRHYSGGDSLYGRYVAVKDINGNKGIYLLHRGVNFGNYYRAAPIIPTAQIPITEEMTSDELEQKAVAICGVVMANGTAADPAINLEYMREAWYFVPMLLGVQLSQAGQHEAALKWLKTIYDYKTGLPVYFSLGLDGGDGNTSNDWDRNMENWLLDPLNPHAIALGRKNNYLKYTVSTIAQTFKAYGDAQFTLDTVESVSKAKELYNEALELMSNEIFRQKPDECFINWNDTLQQTLCLINRPPYTTAVTSLFDDLNRKNSSPQALEVYLEETKDILTADAGTPEFDIDANLAAAADYVGTIPYTPPGVALQTVLDNASTHLENLSDAAMSLPGVEQAGRLMAQKVEADFTHAITQITGRSPAVLGNKKQSINWLQETKQEYSYDYENGDGKELIAERSMSFSNFTGQAAATIAFQRNPQAALNVINKYPFPYIPNDIGGKDFCIAPNPTYDTLILSIELNLFKIRNCMNIAGMKRELDPYAAPTDLYSGLPQIGANGQLLLPGTVNIRPTIYRYRFLLERAKQLANMAQQVESAFLAALEKYDSEKYNMLKAKQDLSLAKATVKLKELQVKVSEGEVEVAVLQKDRSQIQVQELDNMINAGLNAYENTMIDLYWTSVALQDIIAGMDFGIGLSSTVASALSTTTLVGNIASTIHSGVFGILGGIKLGAQIKLNSVQAGINVNSMYAAQARREQSWNYEKTLATQDIKIGEQQVKVAQDRVRVSEQDRKISELQVSNAEATIDFLNNKFTNADLYNWMSGVLERAYSYFIQEAANAARLAQNQLAFERQELPAAIIQDDYWELPAAAASLSGGNGPDRRGLTGSTRLLVDITKLESYAIDSQKRKLQITKTISLAAFFPMEFQQFKETGQITFDTLMDYFDRDYPGHYLRLINKVKVNIIALVPPVQGIKATLTSSGISHVVIGGTVFQDVIVRRDPETIALSGNRESNGMFELQPMDSELMNPFEGSGVHSRWQLKMSKAANHFDFATIADIILTIDYTALSSYDYEKQVQNQLATDFKSQRAFSFRNEFSDAFYQWTHPDEFSGTDGIVSVNISALDFPANLADVKIRELKFYVPTDTSNPDKLVFANPTGKGVKVSLQNAQNPVGTSNFNSKGIISTETNGGGLSAFKNNVSPFGTWSIQLNGLEDALVNNKIQDVIMVIAYEAETPKWI